MYITYLFIFIFFIN